MPCSGAGISDQFEFLQAGSAVQVEARLLGSDGASLWSAAPIMGVVLVTIGGMYTGFFTPVEASAVGAFEQFLNNHGNSEYAGNAHYWLAETYYQQERADDALATYGQLIATHPDHSKVPEASLKSAFILDEQGKRAEAVKALQAVLRDYPGSSVEPLALQRLSDIQKR